MDLFNEDSGCDSGGDSGMNLALKPASVARIVELAREYCTAKQWGEWLSVPLEYAAANGDQELAEELVLAGALGDPISAAVKRGQHDFADRLLQLDHGPTTLRDHHLHLAVQLEDERFVTLFLSRGLQPQEDYLLRVAAALGNEAITSLLLKHGAKPDDSQLHLLREKGYFTPVLIAAKEGHASILGLLLDAGASAGRRLSAHQPVGDESSDGGQRYIEVETESALDHAAIEGHVDVIKTIIERDPSVVNSVAEGTGTTALLCAAKHHQVGAIGALVEAGADLNARDRDGRAPLHVAAESPDCEATLRVLLKHGAKLDVVDHNVLTPLCVAVRRGDVIAANELISAGADVNTSLLSVSGVSNKHSRAMIRTLLRHGANVSTQRARDGNSPLHLAAEKNFLDHVQILLAEGGDETALNHDQKTPMDVTGAEADIITRLFGQLDAVRKALKYARRDRSWSLRTLFVLFRKFPDRIRLPLPLPENERSGEQSPASAAGDRSIISRAHKKATKVDETANGHNAGSTKQVMLGKAERHGDFVAAMDNLLGLQTDVVFSTVIGFL